jgi:hypothetical protein
VLPPVEVRLFETGNGFEETASFSLPSANEAGGFSIATGDLGEDGVPELILGGGLGNAPLVHVLRRDGSEVGTFLAYAAEMGSGIHVEVCDINGDGTNEIVTAPGRGGGPHVRIFDSMGNALGDGGTFVYAEHFRGGVNITCGDVDGDGADEVITLPATAGGPHVRIWDVDNGSLTLQTEFFAFDASHRAGLVGVVHKGILSVASARASEDKTLKSFSLETLPASTTETLLYEADGISSLFYVNDDLHITTTDSHLINHTSGEGILIDSPFESISAASSDLNGDGIEEIITVPSRPLYHEPDKDLPRSIVIDISEQRIFAYEYGVLTNTFLISSARSGYTTPRGTTSVLANPYLVHYAWSYSPGNANNYDLGFVPYNLRIFPHIYIHYAPWHNNFGRPQSHGCVNVNLDNIKWIYGWAEVGDQVVVQD